MAVALRGSAAVPSGNPTTSFTVTIPPEVVTGDVLFLSVTSRDSTTLGSLAVTDDDTGGNAWALAGNSTNFKGTVWWKRATAGTASKTITVSGAVGSSAGVLKCFSGAIAAGDPFTDLVAENNVSGDETHAGFTPTNADSMLCASIHPHLGSASAVSSVSFANDGALDVTQKHSTGGSDCTCALGHRLQSGGPSNTGNLTWVMNNITSNSITWAIPPATGGGNRRRRVLLAAA